VRSQAISVPADPAGSEIDRLLTGGFFAPTPGLVTKIVMTAPSPACNTPDPAEACPVTADLARMAEEGPQTAKDRADRQPDGPLRASRIIGRLAFRSYDTVCLVSDDPVDVATRLVKARFPQAHAAFLGGSAPTSRRTPWSDLDIVVVMDGEPASFRETLRHDGQLVEWFVYTPTSLRHYWRQNVSNRRTPLLRMVAEGVPLIGADGPAETYRVEAAAILTAGPPAPTADQVAFQRYLVTDLLDDLRGCSDPVEIVFLASTLVLAASDLVLLSGNRWSARGKWLPRRLAEVDPELPARLAAAQRAVITDGDREPLVTAVLAILDHSGGPLQEGFRLAGEDPGR
jgi:hypothetical protein